MADEKDLLSGLDIHANSKHRFNSILLSFRNLYDLCRESRIIKRETIDYIATLALTFQNLGLESAAAAKMTASSDYLDEVITFYIRAIEYVLTNKKGMKEKLIFIGERAKEIGKIYKIITAWGSWIAAQSHECLIDAMKEINEYKEKHADVLRKAKIERDAVNDTVEKAKAELKSAKSSAEYWHRVAAATSWIPFANIGTASKARSEISNYKDAKAKEKEDEKLFSRATQNLRKAQRDDEQALIVAKEAGDMLEALNRMETLCQAIASFWELESDRFITQGGAIIADESPYVHLLPVMCDIADEEVRFWRKSKEDLLSYAHDMATFAYLYDWRESPLIDYMRIRIGELPFWLNIPIAIKSEAEKAME